MPKFTSLTRSLRPNAALSQEVGLAFSRRDRLTDDGDSRCAYAPAQKKPRAGRANAGQSGALGLGGK